LANKPLLHWFIFSLWMNACKYPAARIHKIVRQIFGKLEA